MEMKSDVCCNALILRSPLYGCHDIFPLRVCDHREKSPYQLRGARAINQVGRDPEMFTRVEPYLTAKFSVKNGGRILYDVRKCNRRRFFFFLFFLLVVEMKTGEWRQLFQFGVESEVVR